MFWLWLLLYGMLFAAPRALVPAAAPLLTPTTIICALIVIVCGILTAADGKDLFSKSKA